MLLGARRCAGPRWSQLRLAGGVLDAELLLAGLPPWGRVAVLACDRFGLPPPEGVVQVIDAARTVAPVVRRPAPGAVAGSRGRGERVRRWWCS